VFELHSSLLEGVLKTVVLSAAGFVENRVLSGAGGVQAWLTN
jgi:hypothetical protein